MISVVGLNLRDVSYVASHLRAQDRAEIEAQMGPVPPIALAIATIQSSSEYGWTVLDDGQPIAVFGVSPSEMPHLRHAWAWGTERFVRAVPEITRRQPAIRDALRAAGVRRIEARAIADHDLVIRWLTSPKMAFENEGTLRAFGREGQDFALLALVL